MVRKKISKFSQTYIFIKKFNFLSQANNKIAFESLGENESTGTTIGHITVNCEECQTKGFNLISNGNFKKGLEDWKNNEHLPVIVDGNEFGLSFDDKDVKFAKFSKDKEEYLIQDFNSPIDQKCELTLIIAKPKDELLIHAGITIEVNKDIIIQLCKANNYEINSINEEVNVKEGINNINIIANGFLITDVEISCARR